MLQIIDREFKNLKDLIKYINSISIQYDYLKDYEIIKEKDKYTLLLKFDVPEVMILLELARLNIEEDKHCLIYRCYYRIELEDKSEATFASINFQDFPNGLQIQGSFGIGRVCDLMEIRYEYPKDYFTIELRNFNFSNKGLSTIVENTLCVKEVDHTIIYNHIVKFLINRGYLIDKISLLELEQNLYYVAKWLNKREFIQKLNMH